MTGKNIVKDQRILAFLMEHAEKDAVSFHMPGHKGREIYEKYGYGGFLNRAVDCDITEIDGADNLFKSEGIIRNTEIKYKDIYGVKDSHLLINGTSGGIIAAVLSCVNPGGKLIMARNCHKSVFNAVRLGGITPVYVYPGIIDEYGIAGPIRAEDISRLMDEEPEAKTVILPSPDYYGVCSDIKKIADTVHRKGGILIIDQAHGALLKFMEKAPVSAETAGADIIINSTHKTLASFTQSAVLNVNSERVDVDILKDRLQMIESSSPSYILMASLDINAEIIEKHGKELFGQWQYNVEYFYRAASEIKGLKTIDMPEIMDSTKINMDMSAYGLSGAELERKLIEKNIFPELACGDLLMCMTGIGNTKQDMDRLLEALADIAEEYKPHYKAKEIRRKGNINKVWTKVRKKASGSTAGEKCLIDIDECCGMVCGASVIPYPPGIPLVCPGEIIESDDIEFIKRLRNLRYDVIGLTEDEKITVIC